jgi:class 3 adenylate cyclase
MTDGGAENSSSSSAQNIGMEAVLRDASKVRGIRLTWLLYLLIVMVIILFALLLVQIIYETNRTLVRTATQAVQAQVSVLSNSVDVENYALKNVFLLMHEMGMSRLNYSSHMYAIVRENFCSRLYGAPMAFAMYNATGDPVWRMRCNLYPVWKGYRRLPRRVMPGPTEVRIADYAWDAALAQHSFYSAHNSSVETYVVLIEKNLLGRTLLVNRFSQYSSASLQYVTSAFVTRMYNDTSPRILFHTLTKTRTTYTATENGTVHDSFEKLFRKICYIGSPYIWHTVSYYPVVRDLSSTSASSAVADVSSSDSDDYPPRPDTRWPTTTTNSIPSPRLEFKRSWGQLSVAHICGMQCYGKPGDTECDFNNPTNIWYVTEYSLIKQIGLSSILNVVGVVSIVALIIFSFVMLLVYISITVPVNFLRVLLLRAVGAADTQTRFQRMVVNLTYRLWLGDLTAIVRSIHILILCFRLNKKYVPDHALRNHAQQLYLRRRKFNFLEEVDLKDDPDTREDTESESDLDPAVVVPPLPGVSAVIPPSETRFLWRAAGPSSSEEGHRTHPPAELDALVVGGAAECTAVRPSCGRGVSPPLTPSRAHPAAAAAASFSTGVAATTTAFEKGVARRPTANTSSCAAPSPCPVGELDSCAFVSGGGTAGGAQEAEVSLAMSVWHSGRNAFSTMTVHRESESTILCVRIPSVSLAYLMNYAAAVIQHRRVMRILLHRIRRHKGALFHRTGDCLAAVWNAFEGCPNHAEVAAICAQEIANAFAPFRVDGLRIGIVLHQGVLVCGTVEYSKTAFETAFGDGPREALAIADLAAAVGSFNITVTEPVKQCLSGLYDCNIVDVVQLPNSAYPLLLFELGGSRCQLHPASTPSPARLAQFAVEYARVFAWFRNHDFGAALRGIEHIRLTAHSTQHEHLLRRLERLCSFFATAPTALPLPYTRAFPAWVNYEAIAQAGLRNDVQHRPQRNNSLLSHSFVDGAVYKGVPAVRDAKEYINDFKQELQENMRRTARKGNGSPTVDEMSTRPHITPQSSPPMRPTADAMTFSERAMSVGSGMELADATSSSSPSPKSRHADPVDWKGADRTFRTDLPPDAAVSVINTTVVPPLSAAVSAMPLLTFDALHISAVAPDAGEVVGPATHATDAAAASVTLCGGPLAAAVATATGDEQALLVGTSIQAAGDSPRDVFALSNRFAMTHRVTDRPPVALAAASPDTTSTTERPAGAALTHPTSSGLYDNMANSVIQSASMSFKCSVNNMLYNNGGTGPTNSAGVNQLPTEIKAKSGTTYLRSTRILGKGSFGSVYLGMDAHSGRLVAIKFLPMPSDESGMEDIEAEVLILQRVNDTHVVQLLSYAFEGDMIVIIMECMLAGSLQNMISAFGSIPSSTARVFMRDVLRGLSKIHSIGVIHRDMKPQNVLLSLAGNCKISDFGASAWLQELARKELQGRICGTPVYLAPEAARGSPAKESDIWSCGIMFLQMITGELPYPPAQLSAGAAVLVFQIGSGIAVPQIPSDLDELDAEFVQACLQVEPSKRLTASALLQLPIFTV